MNIRFSLPRRAIRFALMASALAYGIYATTCKYLATAQLDSQSLNAASDNSRSKLDYVRAEWRAENFSTLPGDIHSILANQNPAQTEVYCGAGPNGEVFRFNAEFPNSVRRINAGFGNDVDKGLSVTTHLAIRNLGEAKTPFLIATVDQRVPVGRPWLYMMDVSRPDALIGVVQPDIASSWGHGIGFFKDDDGNDSLISTYCGHGEVVEYKYSKLRTPDGFVKDGLGYREIGKLPGSGEYLQTIDLDGDGLEELIVASGFRIKQAHLRIYRQQSKSELERVKKLFGDDYVLGDRWCLVKAIHEDNQFGNVRFLAGRATADGAPQIIAWWCSDLLGGECQIMKYTYSHAQRVGRQMLAEGGAFSLWPIDGQMAFADTNSDSVPEVWFASPGGDLWRMVLGYAPPEMAVSAEIAKDDEEETEPVRDVRTSPGVFRLDLICHSSEGFGPIAPLPTSNGASDIMVAMGKSLVRVKAPVGADQTSQPESSESASWSTNREKTLNVRRS